jgi:hypothetical protein
MEKMKATRKLAALVMACLMVAAVSVPMAIGDTVSSGATVSSEAPEVAITDIAPDPVDPGNTVSVSGTLRDHNVPGHSQTQLEGEIATFQYIVYEPDGTTEYATGDITVDFDWSFAFDLGATATEVPAGTWTVSVTATDNEGLADTETMTFVVNEMRGYEIDFTTIAFGDVTIGVEATVEGDDTFGSGGPTIRSTGNVPMDVMISATDMTGEGSEENTIAKENLGADVDGAGEQDLGAERTFDVEIASGETAAISFTLTPPIGTASDIYSGSITVEGV